METIPERILWLIRQLGTTQSGMARDSGVGTKAINSWIKRGIMPRESNLREIADTYGIPSGPLVKFILHGEQPPRIEHGEPINGSGATLLSVDERRKRRLMPDVDTLAKAGASWQTGRHSVQVEEFNADRYIHNPTDHEDAFSFTVEGDSMSPTIRHGDKLVASPTAQVTNGCFCLCHLAFDGSSLVRRVELVDDDSYRLVPLREGHEARVYARDEVRLMRILGRWEPF